MSDFSFKYEHRLVAFIDVMGFKELLVDKEENLKKLNAYYKNALRYLTEKTSQYEAFSPDDGFQKLFVSDAIILSVKLKPALEAENFEIAARFFSAISILQYMLAMDSQIWTRGAVSIGNLYIDETKNILVGPAFVQAFELEKKADFPRVIIDPKVLSFFETNVRRFIEKINKRIITSQLIGQDIPPREGKAPMLNDAIFIDWFRQTFDRSENVDNYFEDLGVRRFYSHELFEKSFKLIQYLEESALQVWEQQRLMVDSSVENNNRYGKIRTYISNLK